MTAKLEKLWHRKKETEQEIQDLQQEFQLEREDMLETIRELHKQVKLVSLTIDQFIPMEHYQQIYERAQWDESSDEWIRLEDGKEQLDAEAFRLKVVGGDHVDRDERVWDAMSNGDECYLMSSFKAKPRPRETQADTATATQEAHSKEAPAAPAPSAAKPADVPDDWVRCRRFGCNDYFDPNSPPSKAHHKAPPNFHEVAKWWSCCPDRKAYDWDDFMQIPGCVMGPCSANKDGGDSAPVRIDDDAPVTAHVKLSNFRKGLIAVGIDAELFDRVVASLMEVKDGDLDAVCDELRKRCTSLMTSPDFGGLCGCARPQRSGRCTRYQQWAVSEGVALGADAAPDRQRGCAVTSRRGVPPVAAPCDADRYQPYQDLPRLGAASAVAPAQTELARPLSSQGPSSDDYDVYIAERGDSMATAGSDDGEAGSDASDFAGGMGSWYYLADSGIGCDAEVVVQLLHHGGRI